MKTIIALLVVVLSVIGVFVYKNSRTSTKIAAPTRIQNTAKSLAINYCKDNKLSQLVIVDISDRHMWSCEAGKQVYSSAVITGMEFLPADLTPTGTYKIYSKQTNLHLRGSDSTGSWDDFVYYWLPFLSNKYGVYGFHDATWRADSDFGHIDPNSKDASHGCVELPLATAKWLYSWSQVGTALTIQS